MLLEVPEFTLFLAVNLGAAVLTLVLLAVVVRRDVHRLLRPALLLAAMTHLLYQWPLVLFSNPIERSIADPWWLATAMHLGVLGLIAWAWASRRLDVTQSRQPAPMLTWVETGLPILMAVGLAAVYLARVPVKCTALYSLVADPHMTLLAREFSIKLVGSSMATYAFGALANAVAPVVVAIALLMLWRGLRQRKLLQVLVWPLVGFAAITLVLLSGTKGLLVPTMLMLVITSFIWNDRWITRIGASAAAIIFLAGSVVVFDLAKERGVEAGSNYDFASCSVELGVCKQSLALMQSLSLRDMSLGLPKSLVRRLDERLVCACNPSLGVDQCSRVEPVIFQRARKPMNAEAVEAQVKRGFTVLEAVFNRAFVIPLQVAGWHFMYAETEANPGLAAMPFARRLLGFSANAAELVYQKYGVIYSDGDKTSTSTAPTGFMLAYPVYLGWRGILLAVSLVILFDIATTGVLRRLRPSLLPIAAGLMASICLNFMVSDFVTVLISHGALVGLLLLAAYAMAPRLQLPRPEEK